MRVAIWCAVLMVIGANVALAQQPPEDPRLAIYRQLLTEANERAAAALGESARLKAQIDKRKQEDDESAKGQKKN